MKKKADLGRSVCLRKSVLASLSLLLACAAMGAGFLAPLHVHAEDVEPLTAVSVKRTMEPLKAVSVVPDYKRPDSYFNDYLGFSRTDLVAYLTEHANEYLGTPYAEVTQQPVLGLDGHMQCEGFVWSVVSAIATENTTDVPCGNIRTEPANGGGWVNWSYYHNVEPIVFNSKDAMLASGVLEKGDVIWSFDVSGPYGLSNSNHVGFFWGDSPKDDKFWESAVKTETEYFAGSANGNRIARIESMSKYPSEWWVFKLSPDVYYDSNFWAGMPAAVKIEPEDDDPFGDDETETEETDETAEPAEPEDTDVQDTDIADTGDMAVTVSSTSEALSEDMQPMQDVRDEQTAQDIPAVPAVTDVQPAEKADAAEPQEPVFFTGEEEDTGYYFTPETEEEEYGYGYY